MWVLMVSTGNIAMCSTEPAIEPAIMNCQNRRPSCAVSGLNWETGRRSGSWNLDAVVASVAILGLRSGVAAEMKVRVFRKCWSDGYEKRDVNNR